MIPEEILDILTALFGLYCAIRFRYNGRITIEQRKKFNRFFQIKQDYGEFDVFVTQFMFLILGILIFLLD
jgi:hypothetical protein